MGGARGSGQGARRVGWGWGWRASPAQLAVLTATRPLGQRAGQARSLQHEGHLPRCGRGLAPESPSLHRWLQSSLGTDYALWRRSRMGSSSPRLDRWHRGWEDRLDNLLGLQFREGLGRRSRSELVWGRPGIHRNCGGGFGRGGWRSRGRLLGGRPGDRGSGGLAGVVGGARSPTLGWHTTPLVEQGVGEPNGGLGCCSPPRVAARGLSVDDCTCQEGQSHQEHRRHQHDHQEAPGPTALQALR